MSEEVLVGGNAFKHMLSNLDVDSEMERLKKEIPATKSASKRDVLIKKLKYLAGLKNIGGKPEETYVLHNVPVLPAIARPVTIGANNKDEYADINHLYKDHMTANNSLRGLGDLLEPSQLISERAALYNGLGAVMGVKDPINAANKARNIKGLLRQVAGVGGPKMGYFQSKVLSKKQDFSGRGTIFADPTLEFNEISMPHESLWTMYKLHVVRDLVQKGYPYLDAEKAYSEKKEAAMSSFNKMIKHVPVIINRNPTLMKTNITAFFPKPTETKSIGINPLVLPYLAGDYDGDAVSVFLPMTPDAIHEAKEKLLAKEQIHDYRKGIGSSMIAPQHEAILGSLYMTEPDMSQQPVTFNTEVEALEALKSGKIKKNTPVIIKEHNK